MTRGGLELAAGLSQIHSHRTAWVNARCNTTWTRCTVPAVSGRPSRPPHRDNKRYMSSMSIVVSLLTLMSPSSGLRWCSTMLRVCASVVDDHAGDACAHPSIKQISHRAGA